jgi:Ca2+-binding RTX toxin-like protein
MAMQCSLPTGTAIGPASFTYTVTDNHLAVSTATVNLTTSLHTIVTAAGDTVSGNAMPSRIDGSAGNAIIHAGTVGDTLIGGPGATLYGGAGIDTFAFHAGFGQETFYSFTATGTKHDVIQFDSTIFADWAHLLGATKQVGLTCRSRSTRPIASRSRTWRSPTSPRRTRILCDG